MSQTNWTNPKRKPCIVCRTRVSLDQYDRYTKHIHPMHLGECCGSMMKRKTAILDERMNKTRMRKWQRLQNMEWEVRVRYVCTLAINLLNEGRENDVHELIDLAFRDND